jgi:hypothetical protein
LIVNHGFYEAVALDFGRIMVLSPGERYAEMSEMSGRLAAFSLWGKRARGTATPCPEMWKVASNFEIRAFRRLLCPIRSRDRFTATLALRINSMAFRSRNPRGRQQGSPTYAADPSWIAQTWQAS